MQVLLLHLLFLVNNIFYKKLEVASACIDDQNDIKVELFELRALFLKTLLKESMTWDLSTYSINYKPILRVVSLRPQFCIWFHEGS